jgi:integrase/recombinase XerC
MTQQAEPTGITTHLPDFIQALQANDRRPRTIDSYTKDIHLFANWFSQQHNREPILTDITPLDVRDYRTYLQQTCGLAPNTVNRRLASMRVFLEWAVEAGHLAVNPAARIRGIKSIDLAPRWLTRTEQHRLLNALERTVQAAQAQASKQMTPALEQALRDRAIVLILLNTGLRVLELAQLTLPDLTISERKGSLYVRDGKGGKARTVPLNGAARNALTKYLAIRPQNNHQQIFLGQRGPIGSRQLLRILKKYARRGGLEPETVTAHTLRHSFGKNLVDAGVSIDQVAMLLGHANLNTTRRYTTPGSGDLERAVEKVTTED